MRQWARCESKNVVQWPIVGNIAGCASFLLTAHNTCQIHDEHGQGKAESANQHKNGNTNNEPQIYCATGPIHSVSLLQNALLFTTGCFRALRHCSSAVDAWLSRLLIFNICYYVVVSHFANSVGYLMSLDFYIYQNSTLVIDWIFEGIELH